MNKITFSLNTKTYPLEAIYSTASVFLDRAYVYLDGEPTKEILVSLKGKEKLNKKQLESLAGEFSNELLNYLLRAEIAKRNQKIRNFIVGTALVSALPVGLLTPGPAAEIPESVDWQEDPLEIAVPWEEKYGKRRSGKTQK
jgi:His-Xaa-Ser system protein HxsD